MNNARRAYIGRFAPSPTGPLHAGSIVAALASWLDARAHHGQWQLRIEDIDPPREQAGAANDIIATLARLGMQADGAIVWQSRNTTRYKNALTALRHKGLVYPCSCSRREIRQRLIELGRLDDNDSVGEAGPIYPGTCRLGPQSERAHYAHRYLVDERVITWADRSAGYQHGAVQQEHLALTSGDFVLKRADGLFSYQLAVVVDDGADQISDVVRGDDLVSSTARQFDLFDQLGLVRPRTLHIPVLVDQYGNKLSKQTNAPAIDASGDEASRLAVLNDALSNLALDPQPATSISEWQSRAIRAWQHSAWHAIE